MRRIYILLALIAIGVTSIARADRLPLPADTPASYRAECASCHLPFAPMLLSSPDWKNVMGNLERHYGDNASLDAKTRGEIEVYLTRRAGSGSRVSGAGDPPRITATDWFRREHREVSAALWRDPRVKSAANCTACHSRAEHESFRAREIKLPK
jgi:cytochrome c553